MLRITNQKERQVGTRINISLLRAHILHVATQTTTVKTLPGDFLWRLVQPHIHHLGSFLFLPTNNFDKYAHIIIRCKAVLFFVSTKETSMLHLPLAMLEKCRNGFHKLAASRQPITRINVNVPTPQAIRAVIGIAISPHRSSAMPAREVFNAFLKKFRRHILLLYQKNIFSSRISALVKRRALLTK